MKQLASSVLARLGLRDWLKHGLFSLQEALGLDNPLGLYRDLNLDLYRIMARSRALARGRRGEQAMRALFLVPRGLLYDLAFQGFLALRLRAYENVACSFFLCYDLPQCLGFRDALHQPENPCPACLAANTAFLARAGLPYTTLADYVGAAERERAWQQVADLTMDDCRRFSYAGLPLGEICFVAMARYFYRANLTAAPQVLQVYREFLYGAILLVETYHRLFAQERPDVLVMIDGSIFWDRIAFEMARRQGLRCITYEDWFADNVGRRWVFQTNGAVGDTDLSERWQDWRDVPLTAAQEETLDQYIAARMRDKLIYPDPVMAEERVLAELGLTRDRPIVALMTNVVWDVAVLGKDIGFHDMFQWVGDTVRHLAGRDLQLVIRVHPAEKIMFSQENVDEYLAAEFPRLPDNVRLVPTESQLSSYTLMNLSRACLVYTSNVGWEAVVRGRPVVVAGLAHYRGKGFTYDVATRDEYRRIIERLPELPPPTPEQIEIARRYAYMFFFRSSLPLAFYECSEPWQVARYTIRSLRDLAPGRSRALDIIANGICGRGDFVLDADA